MAEADVSSKEQVKAAADGLKKILEVLAPEPSAASGTAPTPIVDELYGAISSADVSDFALQARSAVERYRNAMKWLVGAVAAIGLVLFGSVAFTDGNPLDSVLGWLGLGIASIGLVLVLWAATLVFEPEDASLGELATDLERARKVLATAGTSASYATAEMLKGEGWFRPRLAAAFKLGKILEGPESNAHLGHKTVKDLIESIGTRLTGDDDQSRKHQALVLAEMRRKLTSEVAANAAVDARLDELVAGLAKLAADGGSTVPATNADAESETVDAAEPAVLAGPPPPSSTVEARVASQIATLLIDSARCREASRSSAASVLSAQKTLEEGDYQLGLDLLHRDLVLSESGVAQLRGKFNLSRSMLLMGAVLTLIGALLYISAIKSDDSADTSVEVRTGTMLVKENTTTADAFEKKPNCVGQTLDVLYVGDGTPSNVEEFTISVAAPSECRGDFKIPANRAEDDITLTLLPAVDLTES